MRTLTEPMKELASFVELQEQLNKNTGIHLVTGCIESEKTQFAYALCDGYDTVVIACSDEKKALELMEEAALFDRDVLYYPARDLLFYEGDVKGNALTARRLMVVRRLLSEKKVSIITTIDAFLDKVPPILDAIEHQIVVKLNDELIPGALAKKLIRIGYDRVPQVENQGEFSIRGDIIDVYSYTEDKPWRIELWGDEVDNIRSFDAATQRSDEQLKEISIFPAHGTDYSDDNRTYDDRTAEYGDNGQQNFDSEPSVPNRKTKNRKSDTAGECGETADHHEVSFLEYFDTDSTLIILDEPNRLEERAEFVELEYRESIVRRLEKGYVSSGKADIIWSVDRMWALISGMKGVALCTIDCRRDILSFAGIHGIAAKSVGSYTGHLELFKKDIQKYRKDKYRVLIPVGSRTGGRRLCDELNEEGITAFYSEDGDRLLKPGEVMVTYGLVAHGYEYPGIRFIVISESDIFVREHTRKKKKKVHEGESYHEFSDLKVGDYVVHASHGLGIYQGIEKIEMDHVIKDYMKITYAKGGTLYIPATGLDVIQKYSGGGHPKLNSLGGKDWTRTREKVKAAVEEIAQELVELYAVRSRETGYSYGPDTIWQTEFEELFEFEETSDQLQAIADTKRDMQSDKIMDRLICGDVGYGKTEIAIRAAFKAVQESKQVALLVPTTILAQQHYNTFIQRMKDYPVKIELLSRFRTSAQISKALKNLEKGQVDIVIGTHRLLSKDVKFKDLGLLVIDEEQRFGVSHKEKIKQMRKNVDVLTLTATPIPRTLHMSLVGIRDMSVLEEAPVDRTEIQTYVLEYNEETVREAISRELARGGQVYYVYNRVNTISEITAFIRGLLPEANVAFAHGQMSERELEQVMYDFVNGDIDVLVSTTIIETGLDIPNVNTMIIHDADMMGLAQLYQLRGRVGRSSRTAYAFFMYRRNKVLKEVAEKRLRTIREFTELGSGFKIAMKDLEIRGAGNLLGKSQHGHMEAVGYDMYCKMLNTAVRKLKGEDVVTSEYETEVDMPVDAYIPAEYIPNEVQKLDMYKRIAEITSVSEMEDMMDELTDRFGDPPLPVMNLLKVALIRERAHRAGITSLVEKNGLFTLTFYERAPLDPSGIPGILQRGRGRIKFRAQAPTALMYDNNTRTAGMSLSAMDAAEYLLGEVESIVVTGDGSN